VGLGGATGLRKKRDLKHFFHGRKFRKIDLKYYEPEREKGGNTWPYSLYRRNAELIRTLVELTTVGSWSQNNNKGMGGKIYIVKTHLHSCSKRGPGIGVRLMKGEGGFFYF